MARNAIHLYGLRTYGIPESPTKPFVGNSPIEQRKRTSKFTKGGACTTSVGTHPLPQDDYEKTADQQHNLTKVADVGPDTQQGPYKSE